MGLLGSAAAFLPWLQVSDPACTCHVGCFLVHHTGGLSNEQASGEVAHGQAVITAVSVPQAPWTVKVVLSGFLRHGAGIRVSQFPAVLISGLLGTSWRCLLHLCSSFTQPVGYAPPGIYSGSCLLAEVTLGSSKINWCVRSSSDHAGSW